MSDNAPLLEALKQLVRAELQPLVERLAAIEKRQALAVEKEGYTTDEVAERVDREPYTVRQWCNLGQVRAKKVAGRGRKGEWRISHEELLRIQSEGPLAIGTFQGLTRKAS
jgi:transposase